MNIREIWLTFGLLVILAIFTPKLRADEVQIAICNEDGQCIIQADMLQRMVEALEHWHNQAKTCRGA